MDVRAQGQQMGIGRHRLGLELSLKERACPLKALVDGFGVRDQELLHGKGHLL